MHVHVFLSLASRKSVWALTFVTIMNNHNNSDHKQLKQLCTIMVNNNNSYHKQYKNNTVWTIMDNNNKINQKQYKKQYCMNNNGQ